MRKLIVSNLMSLDGYYEGPGNNVMVLPLDAAFDAYNLERLRAADTLLLERNTFEAFKGFWPGVADDPKASETNREISRLDTAIDKVVISDSLTDDESIAPWLNTRIIKHADAHAQIAELKRQAGQEILVFGSHTMWNGLLTSGLVDELHVMLGGVLGGGTPLFVGQPAVALEPIGTPRTWDGSTNVLVRYAVRPATAK